MTTFWLEQINAYLAADQSVCRIMIVDARGSTPREEGADMLVSADQIEGSIGGGRLEFEAIAIARRLITQAISDPAFSDQGFIRHWQGFALGPSLGQCCGGAVMLLFEAYAPSSHHAIRDLLKAEQDAIAIYHDADSRCLPVIYSAEPDHIKHGYDPAAGTYCQLVGKRRRPLYIYGAGHVGRAVMAKTDGLGFDRYWVDDAISRFPPAATEPDADITVVPASDMTIIARHAPADSYHLVLTYSHRLDEAIIHAILMENQFTRLGLIGSVTKRQRFFSSLKQAGIPAELFARVVCPVGLPAIKGKAPEQVALSIAAQLAIWLDEDMAV